LLGVLTLTGMGRSFHVGHDSRLHDHIHAAVITCIDIRTVTARTITAMPVTVRPLRGSIAAGSVACHFIFGCGRLWWDWCTVLPGRQQSP
jgi:hypothetical protein